MNDKIKKNEMGVVCSTYEKRDAYSILVGKPEGKKPLVKPRSRCEDNIQMDLQEVGWGAWTRLIWLRTGTGGRLL